MKRTYKTLTYTNRLQIECLVKQKISIKQIAEFIGVHISTVYRELKRGEYLHRVKVQDYVGYKNKDVKMYSPELAEEKCQENKTVRGAELKIGKRHDLAKYIQDRILIDGWSPVAVAGELKRNHLFDIRFCATTIYSYIRKQVFYGLSMAKISSHKKRNKHVKRAKRAPNGLSIEQRPKEIYNRTEFGHWEMDCVCGSTRPCLLVLTERRTRKEIIYLMKDQTASSVVNCLNRLEHKYGKNFKNVFKTITVDNGSEFVNVDGIEKSIYAGRRTAVYYCHPYRSNERGTNERINREIRRQLPKGTNFMNFTQHDINKVETWVNSYPRQVLNFATSQELFEQELSLLGISKKLI